MKYRPGWEAYAWTKAGRWFRRKRRPATLLGLPGGQPDVVKVAIHALTHTIPDAREALRHTTGWKRVKGTMALVELEAQVYAALPLPKRKRLWPDMTEAEELQLIACLALVVRD